MTCDQALEPKLPVHKPDSVASRRKRSHPGYISGPARDHTGGVSTDAIRAADAPTTELVTAAGDRCAKCQAPLAPDQHYCVNCGERRGRARFSAETLAAPAAASMAAPPAPPAQDRPRFSSAASLVAGVATLLIALGVGVLIGHYSNDNTAARPAAQVITLNGGGTGAGTSASTPTTAGRTTAATSVKVAKTKVVHVTAKVAKAATAAATRVLGSGGNLSKNVNQTVGGSCSGGAGCQNGKFTGNFFGGN
jgi:hypothetical protein